MRQTIGTTSLSTRGLTHLATVLVLLIGATETRAQTVAGPLFGYHTLHNKGLGVFLGLERDVFGRELTVMTSYAGYADEPIRDGERSCYDDEWQRTEFVEGGRQKYWEATLHVLVPVWEGSSRFTPWLLGGLKFSPVAAGGEDSANPRCLLSAAENAFDMNLGLGVTFGSGRFRPFVGAKWEAVVFAGVSASFGGGGAEEAEGSSIEGFEPLEPTPGWRAGLAAADDRSTTGRKVAGFVGGLVFGPSSLWWLFDKAEEGSWIEDNGGFYPTVASGAVIALAALLQGDVRPDEELVREVDALGPEYSRAFRDAYAERLRSRRKREPLISTAVGAGVGIAAIAALSLALVGSG